MGKDLSLAQVRTNYSRTVIPTVGRLYGELCLDVHSASINPLTNQTSVVFFRAVWADRCTSPKRKRRTHDKEQYKNMFIGKHITVIGIK